METHLSSIEAESAGYSRELRVIVVGAGLGGLSLAHGLRKAGISVAVYERDPSPRARSQGHRLHIDADGRRALAAVLPPRLFSLLGAIAGRPAAQVSGFDHQLNPTGVFALHDDLGSADGVGARMPAHVVLDRELLREVLLSGLEDVVEYGRRCVGYDVTRQGVEAWFDDGSVARGSLLVGADGVGSVIRAQRLPAARVVDSGVRLIYGRVPFTSELGRALPSAMFSVFNSILGPGHRFVGVAPVQYRESPDRAARRLAPNIDLTPCGDSLAVMFGQRRENIGLGDEKLSRVDGEQLRDLVLDQLRGWHPLLCDLIERWSPATISPISVRSSVPTPAWPASNVTLLGDAIHAMNPAAGAGANTALRDAAALAAAIGQAADRQSLTRAVAGYEHDMAEHSFAMVRRSAQNGTRMLGADPLPGG